MRQTRAMDPILESFAHLARRRPEHPLIVSPSRHATVAEIDAIAGEVSEQLSERGVGRGWLAGLAAPNGPAFVGGLLGLWKAGCTVILIDWRTPQTERRRALDGIGAGASLECDAVWPDRVGDFRVGVIGEDPAGVDEAASVVKLTSGSTGTPRGILVPAEALVADDEALARSMGLVENERILAALPLSHSYGLSSILMPALMRGSTMVIPDGSGPFDGMTAVTACEVSFLPTVPAVLQALVKMTDPPPLPASLRLLVTAGAPLPPATAVMFRERFGVSAHVFYGASECGGICFDREGSAGERGTLGTPVEGVQLRLDPVDGMGNGEGAVTVRSAAVAHGYIPDPDPNLGNQLFRTSDLGVMVDGELVLRGRLDDLINVKGKKVNPREVEQVLAEIEGVDEAYVVGVDAGDGGHSVRALVASCSSCRVEMESIIQHCRGKLAPHKVPRGVAIVDALPRNPRGKIDRSAVLHLVRGGRS